MNTNIEEEEEGGVNHTLHPIRTTTKQGSTKPVMLGFSLMGGWVVSERGCFIVVERERVNNLFFFLQPTNHH